MIKHEFKDGLVIGANPSGDTDFFLLMNAEMLNDCVDDDGVTAVTLSESDLKAMLNDIQNRKDAAIESKKQQSLLDEALASRS